MKRLYAIALMLAAFSDPCCADKPNILFIAVDDLRPELNSYGATHIHSPNIDRLASQGIQFNNAHVQQSICMASRASLLTGLRPEYHKIYSGSSVVDLVPRVLTINRHFEENGYRMAAFGKIYHYKSDHIAQFGSRWTDGSVDLFGKGKYATQDSLDKLELNRHDPVRPHDDRGPAFESADVRDDAYSDGYNTERAIETLRHFKSSKEPFFLAVGFHKPHLPFNAPEKYWDMYPAASVKLAGIRGAPANATPYTLRDPGELRNYFGMPKRRGESVGVETESVLRRAYFACVSYVDALVGQLLDELDALGLAENTVVILWGDHGYKLGDYGNWNKWTNLTIDTRVPLIVKAPGIKGGLQSDALVELVDIYPTLSELGGLDLPEHLQGTSFVPLLRKPDLEWKKVVFTLWPHDRDRFAQTITGFSVKTDKYNYVQWTRLATNEVLAAELYDHSNDTLETVNVVDLPAYREAVLVMRELLEAGWQQAIPIHR
ncbi:MAG: sulfatase [Xanthomonadales bacterium]|nr:sulfatase [Gammaproteobacteria bacterium]NNL04336.1 sulfatase [Xanthomonadales bacterium]